MTVLFLYPRTWLPLSSKCLSTFFISLCSLLECHPKPLYKQQYAIHTLHTNQLLHIGLPGTETDLSLPDRFVCLLPCGTGKCMYVCVTWALAQRCLCASVLQRKDASSACQFTMPTKGNNFIKVFSRQTKAKQQKKRPY